jgi:hypothetical protein
MYITQTEVKKILAVMEEFPDARSYRLEQTGQSGIGCILNLTMEMELKGRPAQVTVEIAGVEAW